MSETGTLRIEARFKNARLYNAICAQAVPAQSTWPAGIAGQERGPIKPWCDFHGVSFAAVYDLLNLRKGPLRRITPNSTRQELRPICQQLAALLECDAEWLFPADLYKIRWPRLAVDTSHERFLTLTAAPRHVFELPPAQEDDVLQRELQGSIGAALKTLTPREERILRARFGFDGSDGCTLEEVGRVEGIGRGRVQQIEAKALRKLRHPTRSKKLLPYIEAVAGPSDPQP